MVVMDKPNIPINPQLYNVFPKKPESMKNLQKMLPFFFNDLEFLESNVPVVDKIIGGIVQAVAVAEAKFEQVFGGWQPQSNQFGVAPLRPVDCDLPDCRWRWTDGTSASMFWSAADTFIDTFSAAEDELLYIYGYFNLEPRPHTLELYIQPGTAKMPIWSIIPMRLKDKPYIIFPEPFIIEPRSSFQIDASTDTLTTATTEEAGLLGYIFAPMSRLTDKEG